jgi:hypothetical protein
MSTTKLSISRYWFGIRSELDMKSSYGLLTAIAIFIARDVSSFYNSDLIADMHFATIFWSFFSPK